MCVICIKPQGVVINVKDLKLMFEANSHGAGFAILEKGKVYYKKGLMSIEELIQEIKEFNTPKYDLVVHCRLASVGGITSELTHPFPITDKKEKLLSLEGYSKVVLFHNGTLYYNRLSNLSDTADLALKLNELKVTPEKLVKILSLFSDQKFVLMTSKKIYHIGEFFEHKGLLVSNLSWKWVNQFKYYPIKKKWFIFSDDIGI
jgi:predicted glutamine amidotransferase